MSVRSVLAGRETRYRGGLPYLFFVLALFLCGCGPLIMEPTPTPEPIVPTRTPPADHTADSAEIVSADATPQPALTAVGSGLTWDSMIGRIGLAGALGDVEPAVQRGLRFGNFIFWRTSPELPPVVDLAIWQTVRLGQLGQEHEWPAVSGVVERTIEAHPGSFWMVGNEPDVRWQDNATPDEYAQAYHEIYTFIKARDPTARVVAGGIALPTPLRLDYLDRVLAAYGEHYGEPMPVDVWSIHLFVLREEADSWGIGIPPGMDATSGMLYDIEDHDDLSIVRQYVELFRSWMASNGYGDKPLAVTEFGILLPEDYGFPPEIVRAYLVDAFDFFLNATSEAGLAADGGRMVQYAFWYSLHDDGDYKTGNLYDRESDALTDLGSEFRRYVELLGEP